MRAGARRCWSTAARCRSTSTAAPGVATANFLNNPERFARRTRRWEFNVDKANQILDEAGWKKGADGIRAKDGKKLKFVYQTSINAPRQKTQAIVKQACQKAGIEIELKSVTASVFFSSDVANPDTYPHFYCDMQMYTTTMTQPDPELFMRQFLSGEVAQQGRTSGRAATSPAGSNEEYDRLFEAATGELDPVKRAALFIKMNDLVINERGRHPGRAPAAAWRRWRTSSRPPLSGWDSDIWNLQDWYREA